MPDSAAFDIHPVRPEEYAALGELLVAAYLALPGGVDEPAWYLDYLRDVPGRAAVSCVLAATSPQGEVLGGVTYVSGPEDPFSEELAEGDAGVRMLAVDPRRQRLGVGRALMDACVARAREAGRRRIVLHTGTWMHAAHRLYESMGFRREPALDFVPVPGVYLHAYVLTL